MAMNRVQKTYQTQLLHYQGQAEATACLIKKFERRKAGRGRQVQSGTQPDSRHCTDLEEPDEEANRGKLSKMVVEMGTTGIGITGHGSGCGEQAKGRGQLLQDGRGQYCDPPGRIVR